MGDRVLGQATEHALPAIVGVSPAPGANNVGPDWKRSETLSAAPDPRFPDPRIPPTALPTPAPRPSSNVPETPTPNPNIPIWRQKPFATMTPTASPTEQPSELASPAASPTNSPI